MTKPSDLDELLEQTDHALVLSEACFSHTRETCSQIRDSIARSVENLADSRELLRKVDKLCVAKVGTAKIN